MERQSGTARRGRGNRAGLDSDDVVEAALVIIDTSALDGLTLRSLAGALGVQIGTIQHHVGTRDQLLALVVDRIVRDVRVPRARTPERWLLELARSVRSAFVEHPNAAPLLVAAPLPNTVADYTGIEGILAQLQKLGRHGSGLVDAYNAYVGTLFGWIALELSPAAATETERSLRRDLDEIDQVAFPSIHEHRQLLVDRAFNFRWQTASTPGMERSFDLVMRGVIAELTASSRTRVAATQQRVDRRNGHRQ